MATPNIEQPMRHSLPEDLIERLAEFWCEALLANLRRHPIEPSEQKAS
jgi:hypothetical protein